MGGGASLGTFNGAALTEALKLLILFGRDKQGNRFDRVEVDVMSGASAGAMSLAVMLRKAAHQTGPERTAARAKLKKAHEGRYQELSPKSREAAVTAQVIQSAQEKIWVEDITIRKLLADGNLKKLKHVASILDRGAVDEIAARNLEFEGELLDVQPEKKGWILGERVLFACTLTNLSAIEASSEGAYSARGKKTKAVHQAVTSNLHRELRVFDFNFCARELQELPGSGLSGGEPDVCEDEPFPRAWCRYHAGPAIDGHIGDLRTRAAWNKVGATAIASGSFPFAFEPVTLMRSSYEYGGLRKDGGMWPDHLNAVAEKAGTASDPYYKYPFSFVDGGMLNNEPLREAFRLASFLDAHESDGEFERLIVFVDPNIDTSPPNERNQFRQEYELAKTMRPGDMLDRYVLERKTSGEKLLGHLGDLLSVLVDESTELEADKAAQTRNLFALRSTVLQGLDGALNPHPSVKVLHGLWSACRKQLEGEESRRIVPARTLSMPAEIARIVREVPTLRALGGKYAEFQNAMEKKQLPDEAGLWLQALSRLMIDLMLDLGGKKEDASLLSIGPVLNPYSARHEKPIALPGGRLLGFGGFTSSVPRRYEVEIGKYCAQEFLRKVNYIKLEGPGLKYREMTEREKAIYDRDFEAGMKLVQKRLALIVADGFGLWPGVSQAAQWVLKQLIEPRLLGAEGRDVREQKYELRIVVPDGLKLKLDGKDFRDSDVESIEIPDFPSPGTGRRCLITFATARFEGEVFRRWECPHIDEADLRDVAYRLPVYQRFLINPVDSRLNLFCEIELPPSGRLVKEADALPYPIFVCELTEDAENSIQPADTWWLLNDFPSLEDNLM